MTNQTGTQVVLDAGSHSRDRILDIVVEILERDGYDGVQLREVARRSRTSLSTIYKSYPTRDSLILAALESWLEENRYASLADHQPDPHETLHEGLMQVLRSIFQPWEHHPGMLKAFFRARSAPGGARLVHRGLDTVVPAMMKVLDGVDQSLINDLDLIITTVVYGLSGRFAAGEIEITDILPTIERTVFRLTNGHRA